MNTEKGTRPPHAHRAPRERRGSLVVGGGISRHGEWHPPPSQLVPVRMPLPHPRSSLAFRARRSPPTRPLRSVQKVKTASRSRSRRRSLRRWRAWAGARKGPSFSSGARQTDRGSLSRCVAA